DNVIDRDEIERCGPRSQNTQREVNRTRRGQFPPKSFKRRPQSPNKRVDSVKMRSAPCLGVTNNDAGAVYRCANVSLRMPFSNEILSPAFGFLVRISKSLSDVQIGFQRQFTNSRHVGGADVVQSFRWSVLDELEHLLRTTDIHLEYFIPLLWRE